MAIIQAISPRDGSVLGDFEVSDAQAIAEKMADELDSNFDKPLHELLSDREFHVFKLIAEGKGVSEIAELLSLSLTTVSTYRSRVLVKMNMKTNAELIRYAIENNFT